MTPTTSHRGWPLPKHPWSMEMIWHDLLFAHWPVNFSQIRAAVPPALEIDTFAGQAWLGLVPFRMSGIRHRLLPPVPGLRAFAEVNVRTYVKVGDRCGIYFFSLDAPHWPAIAVARWKYGLPYFHAKISARAEGDGIVFQSHRNHRPAPPADLRIRYRPVGSVRLAVPGSLEYWFTERYRLFTVDPMGRIHQAEIHHPPWPLQRAEAEVACNRMIQPLSFSLPDEAPLLHFCRRIKTVAWPHTATWGDARQYPDPPQIPAVARVG